MAQPWAYCILDVACFLLVCMIEVLFHVIDVQPLKRSFSCQDISIQMPIKPQSVSGAALFVGFTLTVLLIVVFEILKNTVFKSKRNREDQEREVSRCGCITLKCWQKRTLFVAFMYIFGGVITLLFSDVCKLMVGRLRPNFLALCMPGVKHLNCTITDVCTGHPIAVYYGRRSFPSGHASLSAFSMVFFALYLEACISSKRTSLLKPGLQVAAVLLALYTSLSRVYDSWHHLSDALAGMALGAAIALFVVFKPLGMFRSHSTTNSHGVARNSTDDVRESGACAVETPSAELEQLA